MTEIINFILHIDKYLIGIVEQYGFLTYLFLFTIVFAETGLVFFPFLPGDSLLFAAGAIAALGSLNIWVLLLVLSTAAVLGDTVNYWIGHFFGEKIVSNPKFPLIKPEHIVKTNAFYAKHGPKTIVLARFVPIVRTFAPFVAGVGKMHYDTFLFYNIIGGLSWVFTFTLTGFFFGNLAFVQKNFELVIVAIILVSVVPMVIEWWKAKKEKTATNT
jgi:membrane-associated protein